VQLAANVSISVNAAISMAAAWQQTLTVTLTQALPVIARSASDDTIHLSTNGTVDCFAAYHRARIRAIRRLAMTGLTL
jgi:hypothetical protein